MAQTFEYEVDRRYAPVLFLFGLRARRDHVEVTDDGRLSARFGVFQLSTSLDNVNGAHITRDYRWWTAVGVRRSFADDGLTFGTNASAGLCVHFASRVPSLTRRSGHSALTVTVKDLEGLQRALGY